MGIFALSASVNYGSGVGYYAYGSEQDKLWKMRNRALNEYNRKTALESIGWFKK